MKRKITFLLLMIFATANIFSQNYTITFDASGTTNTLDSVRIINLTHPDTAMWHDGDIFQLQLNNAINDLEANKENLHIFPNPMQGQADILFNVKQSGIASINIYEITGKEIIHIAENLSQGNHQFQLTGLKQGAYFINIRGNGYFFSSKLISYNSFSNDINLKYNGVIQETITNKYKTTNSSINFNFVSGDILQYTGYAANLTAVVTNSPASDITVTFNFIASLPSVTTDAASSITFYSALSGGNVTSDGGEIVIARGICYATTANPTNANALVSGGSGTGFFTSNLSGLTPGTTYYVRAYATNSIGTAYGNEVSFTTIPLSLPVLTTTTVSSITNSTAISGGKISYDGGAAITARGVCWSTSSNPHIGLTTITFNGADTGSYTSIITGLTAGTTYYMRAYATNSVGTSYGNEVNFTTIPLSLPVLTTTNISSITCNTAVSGGNISSDGGDYVTARGVCWSTSPNPHIGLSTKTLNGAYTGNYFSIITGLTDGTTYYVRAYATNNLGTAYGNEISFTTIPASLPVITTTNVSSIDFTTANSGGNISYDGGVIVTARGVCWSTSPNPHIGLSTKTINGTGIGSFTSNISGLTAGTTYYIRAYATNNAGTAYGNEISFTTIPFGTPVLTSKNVTSITISSATIGGHIISDGGAFVTARGVCWDTLPNPSIALTTKTINGTDTGKYSINITGLTPGTTYYYRAYATNSYGTAYGTEIFFSTTSIQTGIVVDYDGNVYNIVKIGTQDWLKQNLKTTHYKNGAAINHCPLWQNCYAASYAWYNNDSVNYKNIYGALYNWAAVNTGNLCPTGWHVPNNAEWNLLTNYLGGDSIAGGKLKATTIWNSPNTGATNETGFTALPGGYLSEYGQSLFMGIVGYWHCSTPFSSTTDTRSLSKYDKNLSTLSGDLSSGFSVRCLRDTGAQASIPTINTATTSAITAITATSGGNISFDGGAPVTSRGVCWSTSPNPHIGLSTKTNNGADTGSFISNIVGLIPDTTYYIRAYATNSSGIAYGNENSFITLPATLPYLTTTVSSFTSTTAISGGNISFEGGDTIIDRGICWNTSTNPDISLSTKISNGTGIGVFTSNITGLIPNTTYFARAYATNSFGTAYGNEIIFTTNVISLPTLTTSSVSSIGATTAISGGNISCDGGSTVTTRGVCWSIAPNPTISLNTKTTNNNGAGTFTSNMQGLTPTTTYYLRAYATNSIGTAYGNEISFTTPKGLPIITTTPVSLIGARIAISGGNLVFNGGYKIDALGICWSTSPNPTIALSTIANNIWKYKDFKNNMTGLTANTTYYVRAFATNSIGTAYGNEISFTTNTSNVTDYEGNIYDTVHIGNQVWMKENLKTTFYNNGTPIDYSTNSYSYTANYSDYYMDTNVSNSYGRLYNWYAVNSGNLCPIGWHIPSDSEWTTLTNYLGGDSLAGAKLKSFNFIAFSLAENISNESDFTAMAGGLRSGGSWVSKDVAGYYWSSSEFDTAFAWFRKMYFYDNIVIKEKFIKREALSVRCIRDTGAQISLPVVITNPITSNEGNTALSGGNIISNGGATITARGVCWSTSPNPTITLTSKTNDGSGGMGIFTSNIFGLLPNTVYYVRAYAINSMGIVYGNEISFTSLSKVYPVYDIDNNGYDTVHIGTQIWFRENLKTTRYKNGISISYPDTNNLIWENTTNGAYAWYDNDESTYRKTYGALYNWYAVNTGNLCPTGWHAPNLSEITDLITYLGGNSIAGGKLKEASLLHWSDPNSGASNSSGFTALPGGQRDYNGTFKEIYINFNWWSSTSSHISYKTFLYLDEDFNYISLAYSSPNRGFSIRCIKD